MAQAIIPNGIMLGAPGPVGSAPVYAFADSGDPNSKTDPQSLLANCALGTTYQRTDGPDSTHCFYVKTGASNVAAPTGTWTAK
jgi:hypothetical protein